MGNPVTEGLTDRSTVGITEGEKEVTVGPEFGENLKTVRFREDDS